MKALRRTALVLVCAAAPAAAQSPAWTVSGATAATLGVDARLVYRASVPPGAKLAPDALASAATNFAVVKVAPLPDGSWAWTVLPLNVGRLSFVARWILDGKSVAAPPAALEVAGPALPKDADIDDIKGPLAARRALWPWALAALLALGAWAL
ncbi:MAG: hypothetical protein KGM24_06745, partial [Elusimicrobia bacterium]|nr:hypothetical protein [Elusimicrobiota bacterium]